MPTGLRSFEEVDSRELHQELRVLERAAVARTQGYWFVLIVVGAITMISPDRNGWYWSVAIPLGAAAILRFHRRRGLPVAPAGLWYPMAVLWVVGGTNVVADLSVVPSGQIVTYTLIGAGLALLAVFERSVILAWTAAATPVLAAAIAAVESTEPTTYPATIGFTWFFVGLVVWLYRE